MASDRRISQLKVTLRGSRPPIWRRILVRSDIRLSRLHEILQAVMGWTDSHLHQFEAGRTLYGLPDPEFPFDRQDDRKVRLDEVLRRAKDRLRYEYDFGDGWEHDIVLEKIEATQAGRRYPWVLAGKRACPPEDCGGILGFSSFLEAIKDPHHPEHRETLEWVGGRYDPEAFDVEEKNRQIHGGWAPVRHV